uniref:Uncharacterized protein n=1 Tax=Setaria italica TaxID=4555 RepID=K4AND0_SETIT
MQMLGPKRKARGGRKGERITNVARRISGDGERDRPLL